MAAVAAGGVVLVAAFGAALVLADRWSDVSPVAAPGFGLVCGAALALSLRPLPGLRAGPLRELADDRAALWLWLCLRALAIAAAAVLIVAVPAAAMGWRPDPAFAMALAAGVAGAVAAATVVLVLPRLSLRAPKRRHAPAPLTPRFRSRAARLAWIDLTRRHSGVPAGVWAAFCWAGALLIALADPEPRLVALAGVGATGLAFLAAVVTLRFDAAAARLLMFEPTSFHRLAGDCLGVRLAGVAAAAVLIALVSTPAVLAGAALGAVFRCLEFLHAVRGPATAARLLAQLETALVLVVALIAGPLAGLWLIVRAGWLYRRADRSMGLA